MLQSHYRFLGISMNIFLRTLVVILRSMPVCGLKRGFCSLYLSQINAAHGLEMSPRRLFERIDLVKAR